MSQYIFEMIEKVQNQATQWLWTYNNERSKSGIDGITLAMKLKTTAWMLQLSTIENSRISTPQNCYHAFYFLVRSVARTYGADKHTALISTSFSKDCLGAAALTPHPFPVSGLSKVFVSGCSRLLGRVCYVYVTGTIQWKDEKAGQEWRPDTTGPH